MAKEPKSPAGKKTDTKPPAKPSAEGKGVGGGQGASKSVASNMVRLTPVFQKRLKRVAEKHGMKVGAFIEHHLGDMVNKEFREIVEQELLDLRDEQE